MTGRKKKILTIQILIFFIAILLVYLTYYNKNTPTTKNLKVEQKINKDLDGVEKNVFDNIEYSGVDLNGNRYVIESEKAEFEIDKPELINMNIVKAIFYFKDGSILTVNSKNGTYNNKNFNMSFKNQIIAKYNDSYLYSDNLDYLNTEGIITIYGNVSGESIQGNIVADKLKIDVNAKTLDVSMFNKKQIDLILKDNKWEKVLE